MLSSLTFSLVLASASAPKEVSLYVGRNVAPSAKIRVYINSKNVRQATFQIYKLPLEDLRHMFDTARYHPKPQGHPVRSFLVDIAEKKKALPSPQDTYYSRQLNIADLPPGFYLLQTPGFAGQTWATMNVTNLSIVIKRGEKHALAWVTEAKSGKTVTGAEVTSYRKGEKTATAKTDPNGISNLNILPGQDVILVKRGTDAAAVSVMGTSRDGTVVSHMQFDRPVYRPGQQGFFKSILRRVKGLGYEPIANQPVTEELFDAQSTLIERHELKTSAIGTVAGGFDLPKEGALGFYSVRIRQGNNTLSLQNFQVAEYRKPEFKATSSFSQKRYLSGEKIRLTLAAEYYFGAKVPNAQVQMTVRRSPMRWSGGSSDFSDGNLYDRDTYAADEVVLNDIRKTGSDGTLTVELPATQTQYDYNYSFAFTIIDGSNRQITHAASVPVYASSVHVSAVPTVSYVPLGRLLPINVQLADLDGGPVSGNVEIELRHRVWNEKQKREIEETLEKTTVAVPRTGKVTASLPAKESGYLIIRATAKDSGGRTTASVSGIYVADPFTSPEDQKKPPTVGVRLEKQSYTVGETVHGMVETNRAGHPILLTMEGADLLQYQVMRKAGPFSFKLEQASSPNMVFDVNQWVDNNRISSANMIAVLDPTRRLTVGLKPDRDEYSPGDKAKYTVTTKDSKGLPIGAEVALQVVDEAIYAVQSDSTPNLAQTFWGWRPNGVSTVASAPEDVSGGAYQIQKNLGKDAPMRTQFVDTAYWNPFVLTGNSGQASVEFDMPGNLTAWRAQARAVTGATQVGEASAVVRSSRPLTLRIATPRQMVVGDKLNLVGTITNRSKVSEQVKVKVQVDGKVQEQTIQAPASGDAKVMIPVEASQLGSLKIRGEVFNADGTRLDGLEVGVPINPNGVPFREVATGRIGGGNLTFSLPNNRIAGSERVKVRFYAGPANLIPEIEERLLDSSRYSPIIAAEQVETAANQGLDWTNERIREPIAMLGRSHQSSGWGWWDEGTPDPVITARVLRGLAATKKYPEWDTLRASARAAAEYQYASVQFAEYRAHLVEALAIDGSPKAKQWAAEVNESDTPISPTAQLALAHALLLTGSPDQAKVRLDRMAALVSKGTSSYLPVGQGLGWTGSQLEANARLLDLLLEMSPQDGLSDSLADWVIDHSSRYMGPGDTGAVLRALHRYAEVRPSADKVGDLHVKVDGADVPVRRQPDGLWAEATIPATAAGKPISVEGIDPKRPIRYLVEVNAYRTAETEDNSGIRAMFRWEVMNEAGAWEELARPIRPNEPVRASTVVWSDSVTDVVKVVVPIPAGFEFIDQDHLGRAHSEVRDGAVIYYTLLANGLPETFRFYLRAESNGAISVPAVMAQALRRPEVKGNSDALKVSISGG